MKQGKQAIHDQGTNDITSLGAYAAQLQAQAEARGIVLPPAVRLQIGEPSFRTPAHIREAAMQTIDREALTYGPAEGWPWLRELVAAKIKRVNGYTVGAHQIAMTMGGTGALAAALQATVGPGDEVLVPDPCWPLYAMQLTLVGAKGVPYPLDPQSEWLPDVSALEKLISDRTRVFLINSPGNPTGAVFPREIMSQLLDFARKHDLYLLSDECYDQILFEGEHISPATLMDHSEFEEGRFIGIYTFSKTYAMTGWRVGYLVTGSKLIKTVTDVLCANYSNMSTIVQRAAVAALTGPQDCVEEMCNAYKTRRDLAVSLLKEYDRYIYTPHGAFYALIDVRNRQHTTSRRGRQFTLDLLQQRNVAVAPGSGFGEVSAEYVRISLAASEEEIKRGVREICQFAEKN